MLALDRCIFNATSAGTGSFVYASAVTGYQAPSAAGAQSGATYSYDAQSSDLTQWEYGKAVYSSAGGGTFTRIPLGNSSNSTSPINFTLAPVVMITVLNEDLSAPINAFLQANAGGL